jgi:phenylacetate-CoA ligase
MLAILDEFSARASTRANVAQGRHLRRRAVDQRDAREIEERFDIDAVDIYGLSEVIGPGVAQECVETKDGLHIWEDHFYPRSSTRSPARCCPTARKGELVFTSLTKEALPIIRYRTRDLTRLLPGTARRACGGWRRSPAAPTT